MQKAAEGGTSTTLFAKIDTLARRILARRAPVQDTGSFKNRWGDRIRYRCVAAPLSDDGETINAMLGLASYAEIRNTKIAGLTIVTPHELQPACAPRDSRL